MSFLVSKRPFRSFLLSAKTIRYGKPEKRQYNNDYNNKWRLKKKGKNNSKNDEAGKNKITERLTL